MENSQIIGIVMGHVKNLCSDDPVAHDWEHVRRVYEMSKTINLREGGDSFVVQMIALLHDVYDWKFYPNLDIKAKLRQLLSKLGVIEYIDERELQNICFSAANLSYKGEDVDVELSLEGQIVQDADRGDRFGALGFARILAFFGRFGGDCAIHDGKTTTLPREEFELGLKNRSMTAVNYCYEVLGFWVLLNTETARELFESRYDKFSDCVESLLEEWGLKDLTG